MGDDTLTIGGQGGELLGRAAQLEVLWTGRGREARGLVDGRKGHGHDGGAVDEAVGVVAEHGELGHGRLERLGHELLLVDEALPEARRARVARELKVGLETHLASVGAVGGRERGGNLAGVVVRSGEADALEEHLEEDLSVEDERRL